MADVRMLQRQVRDLEAQLARQSSADVPGHHHSDGTARASTSSPTSLASTSHPALQVDLDAQYSEQRSSCGARTVRHSPREEQHSSRVVGHVQTPEGADDSGPSSPEPDDGKRGEMQIYGATSLLHDRASGEFWTRPASTETGSDTIVKTATQDTLISQAAISAQREMILYSTPSLTENVDFDDLPADMALHLLDLHWNRLHLMYLLTYRPAIVDSLINNGPYVNKLLLNAIYLQSSLYSDRDGLRLDPRDPKTTGMAFYNRFKALLPQHIDQPTMPTVVALLLCGACLLPYGKQSAGWVYCGMAYRMMKDLGYHLDFSSAPGQEAGLGLSASDAEIRRRVYWGAYANDKFQSLYLGRSPDVHMSDCNIPQEYLDTYEEMAMWKPYVDPQIAQPADQGIHPYQGQPCYAVSTFQYLLRLSIITEQVIGWFYSVKSARTPEATLLHARREMTSQLAYWCSSLPVHLRFDTAKDPTPPPHQLALQ